MLSAQLPASQRDDGPDSLNHAKGPGALEKAIDRRQDTGGGKGEDEPGAPVLKRIAGQHGGHGE